MHSPIYGIFREREYADYLAGRATGKSLEEMFPLKAHAFRSLSNQLNSDFSGGLKVLEVGMGSGYLLSLLADKGNQVTGIDINPKIVEYASRVFVDKEVRGNLKQGDAFDLEYADSAFDLVINVGTIEHFDLDEQRAFLKEMARVSGGKVLISTPNENPESLYQNFKATSKFYIPETENIMDLGLQCREAGLKVLREGGFHVIGRTKSCPASLRELYQQRGFNLPKEDYVASDLEYLLSCENSLTDSQRKKFGFLKYALAKK